MVLKIETMDTVMGAQLTTQKSLDEVSHLHARKQALASYRICRLLDLRLSNSMVGTCFYRGKS